MREIKFRARYKDTLRVIDDFMTDEPIENINSDSLFVDEYTGLKDKNGLDIYEGDILGIVGNKGSYYGAMEWDEERNGWKQFSPLNRFEIIGNIYENPDLLETN